MGWAGENFESYGAALPAANRVVLARSDGTAGHVLPPLLIGRHAAVRDIADALHALCALHGHFPGLIDHAAERNLIDPARDWLDHARRGFAVERGFLATLASAGGPLPSTPAHAESEAAVALQRRALEMLAQSGRTGCALGAAAALVIDWAAIRPVLDAAGHRFGVTVPACALPDLEATTAMLDRLTTQAATLRAMAFGAQQVFAQQRCLWDLLESRASARDRQ